MSKWLKNTHKDNEGNPSWTRQAGSLCLILLFTGLFFGPITWGQTFVGALALIFGLKGTQKWRESALARKQREGSA